MFIPRKEPRRAKGEVLYRADLGVPGAVQERDLSRLRNVTPGAEAPAAPPLVCVHGFKGCAFGPTHIHGADKRGRSLGVNSPCCSNCGRFWRSRGDVSFEDYYDGRGRCPECR